MSAHVTPVHLPPIHWRTLENGLRVAAVPRGDLPLVAVSLLVEGGASQDPDGKEGLASLVASLLTRGTEGRGPSEVNASIEAVGGRLDVGADRDRLLVTASALREDLDLAMDLVADVTLRPLFDPREVEAARRRTLAELEQSKDDPSLLASRSLLSTCLPAGHPYASPSIGGGRSVASLSLEDLRGFHRERMAPGRSILVVVGDVEPERVHELAALHFAPWAAEGRLGDVAPPPLAPPARILVVHKEEATQAQVRLVSPVGLARGDRLFFPAVVANAAFGGGFTSRLVNEIRVNRGLSYSVGSAFLLMRHGSFFTFSSFTRNETVAELLSVVTAEAARAREEGFASDEVDRARRYLAGLYPLGLETNEQVAGAVLELAFHGLDEEWVSLYRQRLMDVSPSELGEAAGAFFFPRPPSMVLVGDEEAILKGLAEAGIRGDVERRSLDEAVGA